MWTALKAGAKNLLKKKATEKAVNTVSGSGGENNNNNMIIIIVISIVALLCLIFFIMLPVVYIASPVFNWMSKLDGITRAADKLGSNYSDDSTFKCFFCRDSKEIEKQFENTLKKVKEKNGSKVDYPVLLSSVYYGQDYEDITDATIIDNLEKEASEEEDGWFEQMWNALFKESPETEKVNKYKKRLDKVVAAMTKDNGKYNEKEYIEWMKTDYIPNTLYDGQEITDAKKEQVSNEIIALANLYRNSGTKKKSCSSGVAFDIPQEFDQAYTVTGYDYWIESGGPMVWSEGTIQRELADRWKEQGSKFEDGLAVLDDRYLVATAQTFGIAGTLLDIQLEDGTIIPCIIGDEKNINDDNYTEFGHQYGNTLNVVEFEVERNTFNTYGGNPGTHGWKEEWNQKVVKVYINGACQNYDLESYYETSQNAVGTSEYPWEELKNIGSSVEEFNQHIADNVNSAGFGTREGVVAAAISLVGDFTVQTNYKLQYGWGQDGCPLSRHPQEFEGIAPTNTPFALDCSSFASWAVYNGGFNHPGGNYAWTTRGFKYWADSHNALGDSSNGDAKPGDMLLSSGHIQVVLGTYEDGYYVAHASWCTGEGLEITKVAFNSGYMPWVIYMDEYYEQEKR